MPRIGDSLWSGGMTPMDETDALRTSLQLEKSMRSEKAAARKRRAKLSAARRACPHNEVSMKWDWFDAWLYVHCLECGLDKKYRMERAPKWLADKLDAGEDISYEIATQWQFRKRNKVV